MRFPEPLKDFIDTTTWTFARTMPLRPHEYIVRDRVDKALFEEMVRHIRQHGFEGRFYRRSITYFAEDDLLYWTMGAPIEETTIINRCREEDLLRGKTEERNVAVRGNTRRRVSSRGSRFFSVP